MHKGTVLEELWARVPILLLPGLAAAPEMNVPNG